MNTPIPAKRGRKPKQIEPVTDDDTGIINRMDDDTVKPEPPLRGFMGETCPPCPESDPTLGMKTPAVVAWWFEFHPEEAAVKYAGLTLPQLED